MIGEIQADADEMPHTADARPDAYPRIERGQGGRVQVAQAPQRVPGQQRAVDVVHDVREVPIGALAVEHARPLAPRRTVSEEFHGEAPQRMGCPQGMNSPSPARPRNSKSWLTSRPRENVMTGQPVTVRPS